MLHSTAAHSSECCRIKDSSWFSVLLHHFESLTFRLHTQTYNPLPIPSNAQPAAYAITPMLNYTDVSNADGLTPPLFALAGRNVDFSLRLTGDAAALPRQACAQWCQLGSGQAQECFSGGIGSESATVRQQDTAARRQTWH
jgi:hypothetical protein